MEKQKIQIVGRAELIEVDKIPEVVVELLSKYRNIVRDLEITIPTIEKERVKRFLIKKYESSKGVVQALEKGFVPVLVESPISLKPKSEITGAELKELMETLPPEAKAALERAKKLGIFDEFAVSGGPRGGDPVIVGVVGNKFFLIAAWVNLDNRGAVGYTFRSEE